MLDEVTQGFSQARGQALLGLDGILTAEKGTYRLNADFLSALARADRPLVSDPVGGLIQALNAYE